MMQRPRLPIAGALVFLLALVLAGNAGAQATDYPSRAIRMIIPYAPGGPDDLIGRIVGKKLADVWGQPVLIDNRPGAGGTVAMGLTAKSPPDGYTIAVGDTGQLAMAPGLYAKLPYHPLRDLTPVANVASLPYVLVVNPSVPAQTVRELIQLAKSKKGSMTHASTGTGSSSHLAWEMFKSITGVEILHVPYKGAGPYVTALIAGEIDMAITDLALVTPHAKAGKLRLLATTSNKRPAAAPQLPTITEGGVDGYVLDIWAGIVAPAGTPGNILSKLNSAIVTGLRAADVRKRFDELGYTAVGDTPEQFAATIRAEIEKYGRIIKNANISLQ